MASTTTTTAYFKKQAKQIRWDAGERLPSALRALRSAKNPRRLNIFSKAACERDILEAESEVQLAKIANIHAEARLTALFEMLAMLDLEPLERWNVKRILLNTLNPPPTPKELRTEEKAKCAYTLSAWAGYELLSAFDSAEAEDLENQKPATSLDGEGGYRLGNGAHNVLPLDPED